MAWLIEKDESNASRRVIEFRTFKSDGTSPDTGSSNSSLRMSIGGNAQFTPNALVSAISANAGMYYLTLTQSDVSALGNHSLWYEGAFPQEVARVQVVGFNPFSRVSAFDPSTTSVGLKAQVHSQATVGGLVNYSNLSGSLSGLTIRGIENYSNLSGAFSGLTIRGLENYSNLSGSLSGLTIRGIENWSNLSGTISNLTVQVSSGTVSGVVNKVDLRAGTYSDISLRLDANAVPAGAFQTDSIDAVALAAMNLSDVTVRVHPMNYSGLTVQGLANYSNLSGTFSNLTVQVSGGTVTGVTNIVQSNLTQIRGDATAVQRLLSHLSSVVTGQAVAGQLSTTTMTADVTETTADHFNDRVVVFTSGALIGQATSITSFFGASNGSSRFVFPALTEAPTAGDEFIVV